MVIFFSQSLLVLQEGVSSSALEDIDSFNYTWLLDLVKRMEWSNEVTNMLLVGMHDVVTPTHTTPRKIFMFRSAQKALEKRTHILFMPWSIS